MFNIWIRAILMVLAAGLFVVFLTAMMCNPIVGQISCMIAMIVLIIVAMWYLFERFSGQD